MTAVRRGASMGARVTTRSRFEIEGERVGKRQQNPARLGVLAPELEEVVLGHPLPVAEVEASRALDEGDRAGDERFFRSRGDRGDGPDDRAVHEEAHRREVQREPQPARFVDDGEDALRDLAELQEPLEPVGGLALQHVARGGPCRPERTRTWATRSAVPSEISRASARRWTRYA